MSDRITLLSHNSNILAKRWKQNSDIESYSLAKFFRVRDREVKDIRELSHLLKALSKDTYSCVIRGEYVGNAKAKELDPEFQHGKVRRLASLFDDKPLHSIMIDVDSYEPITCSPIDDPENAIQEYVFTELPEMFQGASYHWQLSNSAGKKGKEHILKVHLWFWLTNPYTSADLHNWAKQEARSFDISIFNSVRVHYTANPVFDDGVRDPISQRSGFVEGIITDTVDLTIDTSLTPTQRLRVYSAGNGEVPTDEIADALRDHQAYKGETEDGRVFLECPFIDEHTVPTNSLQETAYFPRKTGGFEQGHFKCFHAHCEKREDDEFIRALGLHVLGFDDVTNVEFVGKNEQGLTSTFIDTPDFKRTTKGNIMPSRHNLDLALRRADFIGVDIRHDTFLGQTVVTEPNTCKSRPFNDNDYFFICKTLEARGFDHVKRDLIREAIPAVAEDRCADVAQEWLKTLPKWDGVERLKTFVSDYLGTPNDEYHQAVGYYIWTTLAGRASTLGVKADMIPVLSGKQGIRKSTFVASMSPFYDWFTTINFSDDANDKARKMRGRVIMEIPELRGLNNRDIEYIKDFASRTKEEWIPKFKESTTAYYRRCLLIGTTNDDNFLGDDTGNRRWLPIQTLKCEVEKLKANRDQLWAEGLHVFKEKGVDWSAEKLAEDEHKRFKVSDDWSVPIKSWLETPNINGVCPQDLNILKTFDILTQALGVTTSRVNAPDARRIKRIMPDFGYKYAHDLHNGRHWRKV